MSSLDRLTATQLDDTAWDLRNAALVVEHAGHTQGCNVLTTTGEVCAAASIELATHSKLVTIMPGHWNQVGITAGRGLDSLVYRSENAYAVFTEFLPTSLCDKCTPCADNSCNDAWCPRVHHDGAWERVVHYNDAHCTGGQLLAGLLRLAADRAQIAARDRRTMLAGRLLETA